MNNPNGSTGPLHLTPAERHAFLAKRGMSEGWLLLTRAEMNAMRQAMEGSSKENERLNKELARMIQRDMNKPEITPQRLFELCQKADLMTGAWKGLKWEDLPVAAKEAVSSAIPNPKDVGKVVPMLPQN